MLAHQGMEKKGKEKPWHENQEGKTLLQSVSAEKVWKLPPPHLGEMGCPEKTLKKRSKVSTVPSETQRLWGPSFPRHAIDKDTLQTN